MRKPSWISILALPVVFALGCAPESEPAPEATAHAAFGTYTNDAEAVWDGSKRYSEYIPAKDGTKLAVDVYLPTRDGAEPSDPVPVVLHYTRYIRAIEQEDGTVQGVGDNDPILRHLLKHGFAVAVADARGTGSSFGMHVGAFSEDETADSYAIIEWLGSQPWSNGKVGMSGRSYPGMTQYQAATQAPPALKAIFAEMAGPSAYDFVNRGGAYKKDFVDVWGSLTREMDLGESGKSARVDTDIEGDSRQEAIAEHAKNLWAPDFEKYDDWDTRDFAVDYEGSHWDWNTIATIDNAAKIAASGIGVYHLVGWYDIYTTQQPWLFANLDGAPQKMMIGPWVHSGGYGSPVHKAEILRWYDYWLKGIDNGVLDEEPVHYFVMRSNHTLPASADAPDGPDPDEKVANEDGGAWVGTREWPPAGSTRRRFFLATGPSGTVSSVNDGVLAGGEAPAAAGRDRYTVDYSSRMGSFSRWMNGYGGRRETPEGSTFFDERTPEDRKALTYTTEPMTEDLTLTGYPVVHLWVTSTASDGDFFAYLEEIDDQGNSHYLSEGVLRASHRKTSPAPFDDLDLPWHRSFEEDLEPLVPGEPAELDFDLMGTATVIDAGHRIRITITGADAANYQSWPDPEGKQAPTVEVLTGGEQASYVELPVMNGGPT